VVDISDNEVVYDNELLRDKKVAPDNEAVYDNVPGVKKEGFSTNAKAQTNPTDSIPKRPSKAAPSPGPRSPKPPSIASRGSPMPRSPRPRSSLFTSPSVGLSPAMMRDAMMLDSKRVQAEDWQLSSNPSNLGDQDVWEVDAKSPPPPTIPRDDGSDFGVHQRAQPQRSTAPDDPLPPIVESPGADDSSDEN
jgi:hypothetical protein